MVSDVKFPVLSNGYGFRTIRANAAEKNPENRGHSQIRQFWLHHSIQRAKLALENLEYRPFPKIDFSRISTSLTHEVVQSYI